MYLSALQRVLGLRTLIFLNRLQQITGRGYATRAFKTHSFLGHQLRSYVTKPIENEKTTSFESIVSKLNSDFTHNGYVSASNFRALLKSLQTTGGSLTTEESIFLLESCTPELMPSLTATNRMELFNKLWDHLDQSNSLNNKHYISYVKVHADNGLPIEDFRKFLKEKQLENLPQMYEVLIQSACQLGQIDLAIEVLTEMKAKGISLTEFVFNALIMGHGNNRDLTNAMVVLETMKAARVEPSYSTFTQLIKACIQNNNIEKATALFSEHSGQFKTDHVIEIIKTLAITKQAKINRNFLELLINDLPTDFLTSKEVPIPLRNLCTELVHSDRLEEAFAIVDCLPCPKFNANQDIDTYGYVFLQDLFRCRIKPEKIIEIANSLMSSGKNSRALHVACDSAMQRNPDHGHTYLKALAEIETLRPHYFWPLLLHKFRNNGEAGIFKVLKMMTELKVDCDYETLSYYVLPKLAVTLDNPQQAIKMFESCGLKTSQSLSPLIAQLIGNQKLEEVMKIAELYTSKLDTQLFVQPLANLALRIRATKRYKKFCNTIHTLHLKSSNPKEDFVGQVLLEIIGLKKLHNDHSMLTRIVSDLSGLGSKISAAAAVSLNAHFIKIKTEITDIPRIRSMLTSMTDRRLVLNVTDDNTTNPNIVHPKDMSSEELECHLLELEAKNMNTRGVLRRLLQICVRDNNLVRALEVKKKCELAKVDLSPGMLASILDMYIKLNDLTSAKSSFEQLQKTYPGFLLDEHKILDFAGLLVRNDELEKAKEILSERAESTKVFGGDYVIKNVWNLLNSVAQLAANKADLPKERNLTREMFCFVRKLGFCNAHNTVLGPIVREYILRKDIDSAVNEFQTLADTYRHTPLQYELSSLLVRLSNQKDENFNVNTEEAKHLLQQVTRTVSSVHGQINMNSSLLLAIAESGTDSQLRKLLINPEFRLDNKMLVKNCDHLKNEGSVQTLMRLAKACRGLTHVIKEDDLYNMLLKKFIDENNCAASLELFEKLEADDDLKISQEFLKNLVNLLSFNKIEIPSSLNLRVGFLK